MRPQQGFSAPRNSRPLFPVVVGIVCSIISAIALSSAAWPCDPPIIFNSNFQNVTWGTPNLLVAACPASDSVPVSGGPCIPSRLRIFVRYRDASGNNKVGVPPDSIWVQTQSAFNLRANDQLAITADDSTNADGYARITIPSLSGCGWLQIYLFVDGWSVGVSFPVK